MITYEIGFLTLSDVQPLEYDNIHSAHLGQDLQDIQSGLDINKYSPIIDNAAQTLKVE